MKDTLSAICAALLAGALLPGCGSGGVTDDPDPSADGSTPGQEDGGSPGSDGSIGPDSSNPDDPDAGTPGDDLAAELLALVGSCNDVLGGQYATDFGDQEHISVCGLHGAVFWKADLDVDCDGLETQVCNGNTDSAFQNRTSATDSNGNWLDASTLPYVVIPLASERFDYESADIDLGTVVAVIYHGQVQFGVFGDQGPREIIGEASYRMAQLLGIDPDPNTGGTDDEVVYIAFTGASARVSVMEDHGEAVAIGEAHAAAVLQDNP